MAKDMELKDIKTTLKDVERNKRDVDIRQKDIRNYILPERGVFMADNERPNRRDHSIGKRILNKTGTRAMKRLAAGMHGGLTSPARPWFRLGLEDKDLQEFGAVKTWLGQVQKAMYRRFRNSNFYSAVQTLYEEVGGFGGGLIMVEEDPDYTVRYRVSTVGTYWLLSNEAGFIDKAFRRFWLAAHNMVAQFGEKKVSKDVLRAYKDGEVKYFEVCHAIMPRKQRDEDKVDVYNMPFRDLYWEHKSKDTFLYEGGFSEQPFMAPRWDVNAMDDYGTGCGDDVLPDVKMLQEKVLTHTKALHKSVEPPLKVPPSFKGRLQVTPNAQNFISSTEKDSVGALYDVNPHTAELSQDIELLKHEIREGCYLDLFQMLAAYDQQMTATEVAERKEEKLILLGPVVERQEFELLNLLVDRQFAIQYRNGEIPPPPDEIEEGTALEIEYISLLAQAQKLVGTNAMNAVVDFSGRCAEVQALTSNSPVLDKINFDQSIDDYAEMVGAPSKMVNGDDEVAEIRKARQEVMQRQREQQQKQQDIAAAKDLSQVDTSEGSALANLAETVGTA